MERAEGGGLAPRQPGAESAGSPPCDPELSSSYCPARPATFIKPLVCTMYLALRSGRTGEGESEPPGCEGRGKCEKDVLVSRCPGEEQQERKSQPFHYRLGAPTWLCLSHSCHWPSFLAHHCSNLGAGNLSGLSQPPLQSCPELLHRAGHLVLTDQPPQCCPLPTFLNIKDCGPLD